MHLLLLGLLGLPTAGANLQRDGYSKSVLASLSGVVLLGVYYICDGGIDRLITIYKEPKHIIPFFFFDPGMFKAPVVLVEVQEACF